MVVPTDTTVTLDITRPGRRPLVVDPGARRQVRRRSPATTNYTWFKPDARRASSPASAPSSAGATTPNMIAAVRAVTPAEFEAWLAEQKAAIDGRQRRRGQAQRADPQRPPRLTAPRHLRPWPPPPTRQTAPRRRSRAPADRAPARSTASRAAGRRWVTTTDHKRIGIMYMVTTFVFFVLGGVEALMMRLQLGHAGQHAARPRRRTTRCSRCTGRR